MYRCTLHVSCIQYFHMHVEYTHLAHVRSLHACSNSCQMHAASELHLLIFVRGALETRKKAKRSHAFIFRFSIKVSVKWPYGALLYHQAGKNSGKLSLSLQYLVAQCEICQGFMNFGICNLFCGCRYFKNLAYIQINLSM